MRISDIVLDYNSVLRANYTIGELDNIAMNGAGKVAVLNKGGFLMLDSEGATKEEVNVPNFRCIRADITVNIGGWEFLWTNAHGSVRRGTIVLNATDDRTRELTYVGFRKKVSAASDLLRKTMGDAYTHVMTDDELMWFTKSICLSGSIRRHGTILVALLLQYGEPLVSKRIRQDINVILDTYALPREDATEEDIANAIESVVALDPVFKSTTYRDIRRGYKTWQHYLEGAGD